jgi:hypothetical protein
MNVSATLATRRLQTVFELYEMAVQLQRQNLRRRNPDWSPEQVQAALCAWLRSRPHAPQGDCIGISRPWPPDP